jgi:hypothetical protein
VHPEKAGAIGAQTTDALARSKQTPCNPQRDSPTNLAATAHEQAQMKKDALRDVLFDGLDRDLATALLLVHRFLELGAGGKLGDLRRRNPDFGAGSGVAAFARRPPAH